MRSKTFDLLIPSILIGVFLSVVFIAGKILHPFWAESRFVPINELNAHEVNILVFTPNNAEIIKYGDLDEYLKEHKDYSFTVSNDKFDFYHTKIFENFQKTSIESHLSLNFVQFNNCQSIELRIDGNRRNSVTRYEATEKGIFLKTYLTENLFTELPFLLIILTIGFLFTLFTNSLLRKSINFSKLS